MPVKIRLRRMGAKKRPFYRLVVANSTDSRDGRFIESIGYYDPCSNPPAIKVNAEKAAYWIRCGAQPSDTARALLKKQGLLGGAAPAPVQSAPAAAAPTATALPAAAAPAEAVDAAPPTEAVDAAAPDDSSLSTAAPAEEPVAEDAAPVKKTRASRKTAETPQAAE